MTKILKKQINKQVLSGIKKEVASKVIPNNIVVIGASSGGPKEVEKIVTSLPKRLNAGIVIVQHMPSGFTKTFAKRLSKHCKINIREAQSGDFLKPGLVLVAPGGYNLKARPEETILDKKLAVVVKLIKNPKTILKPCIDIMMESVVKILGKNTVGIILSGMGEDGLIGMKAVFKAGGITIVQKENTADIPGLPRRIIKENIVDYKLTPFEIASRIVEIVGEY